MEVKKGRELMDKVFSIDEIFGSENVKVQAIHAPNGKHRRCSGCFFWRNDYPNCYKPAYVGSCIENGKYFIFIKIQD